MQIICVVSLCVINILLNEKLQIGSLSVAYSYTSHDNARRMERNKMVIPSDI